MNEEAANSTRNTIYSLKVFLGSLPKALRLIICNEVRSEKGYQSRLFWSEVGYGLCTLVLNWICFLEELATSSSFGDKIVSLLMFTPTTVYVP